MAPDVLPPLSRPASALWHTMDERTREARAELEARAGVGDVLRLTQRRHELAREAAPYRALRDTFDARRKAVRGQVLARINRERAAKATPEKEVAATLAETIASGDAEYIRFLDDCAAAFAVLVVVEDEIQAITDILHRDQALLRYAANEPRG